MSDTHEIPVGSDASSRRKLHAVLLDIDGTLLDSNDAHARAWMVALAEHGRPMPYDVIRPLIGKGGDKLLNELLGVDDESPDGKAINEARLRVFSERWLSTLRPTRGARALLEQCIADGIRLVVATSASGPELDGLLRQAGVADLIRLSATSSDAESSKPDPDIVHAAMQKVGVKAENAVMLGDTPYDIVAAAKAGVATIALRCGGWWSDGQLGEAATIHDDPASLVAAWQQRPFEQALVIAAART